MIEATKEKSLGFFKARKTGNYVSVTIPAQAEIEAGQRLVVIQASNGDLIYRPQK